MTVDFETAKMLKDAGYNVPHFNYYYENELQLHGCVQVNHNIEDDYYTAPTLSEAADWLRENKGLHVIVGFAEDGWFYLLDELKIARSIVELVGAERFNTHDTAISAAIKHALNHLKQGK